MFQCSCLNQNEFVTTFQSGFRAGPTHRKTPLELVETLSFEFSGAFVVQKLQNAIFENVDVHNSRGEENVPILV